MVKLGKWLPFLFLAVIASCSSKNDAPLFRIQENGLYGFIDSIGNVVIEPQYKYVGHFNKEGYATVITEFQYSCEEREDLFGYGYTFTDTVLAIRYGFIDKSNKLVVDTIHTLELSRIQIMLMGFDNAYVDVMVKAFNGGGLNFRSEIYDDRIKLKSGLFVVQDKETKKMGYMNLKGDTIVPAKYDCCHPFFNGIARVSDFDFRSMRFPNVEILIDSLGNEFADEGYLRIGDFNYDKSWAKKLVFSEDEENTYWLLLDREGKVCSDSVNGFWGNTTIYNGPGEWYLLQWDFMIGDYYFNTFYSFINKEGKWATDWNNDGEIEVPFTNEYTPEVLTGATFMKDSLVGIKIRYDNSPAWVFANYNFEVLSQPFDSLLQFRQGLAAVKEFSDNKESKWGFVDKQFEQVIPYKYDETGYFVNGLSYFRISYIEGYINKRGEVVWSTKM